MNWKSFKEYIPYLSGLIILLGLIRQMVYYGHYNIEIQNYIGVSELLLAWIDESFLFISFLFLIFFTTKGFFPLFNFKNSNSKRLVLIYSLIASFIVFITFFFIENYTLDAFVLVFLFFPISFPAAYILADSFCEDCFNQNLELSTFKIIYIPIVALVLLIFLTKGSTQSVNEGKYIGTKIYTSDSTFVSDSSHCFIGKTEKYYFIYNKDKKSTVVIPERDVSKFELHSEIPIKK